MQPRNLLVVSLLPLFAACASTPPVPASTRAQIEYARLLAALRSPIAHLDIENQPLEKVLGGVAEQYHLNMDVKWAALHEVGIEKTTPVTIHLHDVTLNTALSLICFDASAEKPAGFAAFGGILVVSTKSDLPRTPPQMMVRQTFDVRDLVTKPTLTGPTDTTRRMADLIDIIVNHVGLDSWRFIQYPNSRILDFQHRPAGGQWPLDEATADVVRDDASSDAAISVFNTSIIVTQTPERLAEVAALLELLRHK